jgi:hypothetical protein
MRKNITKNVGNRTFESMALFKYLGTILTNNFCSHEEIKKRLYSRIAVYHLVQNLLSFCLLPKIIYKIREL